MPRPRSNCGNRAELTARIAIGCYGPDEPFLDSMMMPRSRPAPSPSSLKSSRRLRVRLQRSRLRRHHVMNGATMAHKVSTRANELLERSLDVVEKDVGEEAVDPGIDAGRVLPVHIALRGNKV